MRYSQPQSEKKLAEVFNLEYDDSMQDWAIMAAVPEKIELFLNAYENDTNLTDDDKFTLMELIIASFDELTTEDLENNCNWLICQNILKRDFVLHKDTLEYWSQFEAENENEMFKITLYIRKIWRDVNNKTYRS